MNRRIEVGDESLEVNNYFEGLCFLFVGISMGREHSSNPFAREECQEAVG